MQSDSRERRSSVGEITDYFQAQITQMAPQTKKPSAKQTKEDEKKRKLELKEAKENIIAMIKADNLPNKESVNANGADQSVSENDNHASMQDTQECTQTEQLAEEQNCSQNNACTQTSEDEILKALKELADKYNKIDHDINDPKDGLSYQLAATQSRVSDLNSDINGAVSGLKVKMQQVTDKAESNASKIQQMENNQARMSALLDENKRLVQELKTMQGLVQKVQQQANISTHQILDLTKRGMEQNLILHGVDDTLEKEDSRREEPMFTFRERPKHAVIDFLKRNLQVDLPVSDIWKAHRMGPMIKDKVRPMVIKVAYDAKELIMEHVSKLKGKTNAETNQKLFIGEQIPEGSVEMKKQTTARLKVLKDANEKKAFSERSKLQVIGDKILIDGKVEEPEVSTPLPSQLFLDVDTQKTVDTLQSKMYETQTITERNSEFKAISIRVHSIEEVNQAYIAVAQRYPASDHIAMGYALREDKQIKSGSCDDREYGAGAKIRNTIFEMKSRNTAVFVMRKYGGVHLGFNRFQIIEKVAREAITLLNI